MSNNDTILYTSPPLSEWELKQRARVAGYAHIDRIAMDGGPVTEPRPIRRRLMASVIGLAGAWICAVGLVIALWGVM